MRTRCPHCHQPIEVVADDPLVEIHCTVCGSAFSLATGGTATYGAKKSQVVGHFELLEKLGSGAFGSVWKAHDRELDRTVAIKLPRQEELDEVETERFWREARAAAQLHHPGIVTIHEIGRDENQMYIVSDFVQGATLGDWVTSKPLTLREIAELIATVADALAHAHTRGVVHRDLKPANILVDGAGKPHLTDFGLAKRDAGEITMTVEGQILGTPAYMSPEQARGEGHLVDLRADIYSLGVLLYELLSGELPFRGSSRMMVMQILHDEPPSPRKLRATIPRDLETITLKCLEKDLAKRYATANDLAADLRRWLTGKPIYARPVTRAERLGRWCRRNPVIASLAAIAAVLLIAVTVVSTSAAVRMAAMAEREGQARSEAEVNFRRARDAVDQMLVTVGDESLENVPYLEDARRGLLENALVFYRELLDANPTNTELRYELALAYQSVGKINGLLGRNDDAEEAYKQAISRLDRLRKEFPENGDHELQLAVTHNELAEHLRATSGPPDVTEQHYRSALAIQLKLAEPEDSTSETRLELTRTHNNLGLLLMDTGRLPESAAELRKAADGLERLINEHPDNLEYESDLARTLINLGVLSRAEGKAAEAERAYEQAVARLSRLVKEHPDDREYQYRCAVSELNLANVIQTDAARRADARRHCVAAKELLQTLKDSYPAIPLYYHELANCCITEANILALLGDPDAARQSFEQALSCFDEVEGRFPDVPKTSAELRSIRGITLGGLAYLARERGELEEARQLVERAIEEQSAAVEIEPANPKYGGFLRGHYSYMGDILEALGEDDEAEAMREKAEQLQGDG